MCGIVGLINHSGKYQSSGERIMKELLWLDTIRGDDATGLYCLTKSGQLEWVKACVDGWSFVYQNETAKKILRDAENHLFIMGHNRSATMGDANDTAHAHPIIVEEKLALVHNGTLTSWPNKPWANSKPKEGEFEHDSTAIAHLIAKEGVQEFVDSTYGAYSLVWHDLEHDTFNFLRNEDRPMAFVHTEQCVFYGSEIGLLLWVIQRNGLKPLKHYFTKPMTHYTFEMGATEPTEVVIRKNYSSGGSRRFRYGSHEGPHGSASRPVITGSGRIDPWNDGESEAGSLSRREAARLDAETTRRSKEATEENEKTSTGEGKEGTRVARRSDELRTSTGGKPHGKQLERWKVFALGEAVMFSCTHYGEVRLEGGGPQYNVEGELRPELAKANPEILVKGVARVHELSRRDLQKTDCYLFGKIRAIVALDSGNVVLWLRDIMLSKVPDPALEKVGVVKKNILIANETGEVIGEVSGNDEVAEASIFTKPVIAPIGVLLDKGRKEREAKKQDREGKELCQSCGEPTARSKLRFLDESYPSSGPTRETVTTYRFCCDCIETYTVDRSKVVPEAVKDRVVKSTQIRLF